MRFRSWAASSAKGVSAKRTGDFPKQRARLGMLADPVQRHAGFEARPGRQSKIVIVHQRQPQQRRRRQFIIVLAGVDASQRKYGPARRSSGISSIRCRHWAALQSAEISGEGLCPPAPAPAPGRARGQSVLDDSSFRTLRASFPARGRHTAGWRPINRPASTLPCIHA